MFLAQKARLKLFKVRREKLNLQFKQRSLGVLLLDAPVILVEEVVVVWVRGKGGSACVCCDRLSCARPD